jgi:hypothetical protein
MGFKRLEAGYFLPADVASIGWGSAALPLAEPIKSSGS